MTTLELLNDLQRLNIILIREGTELYIDGPDETLTDELVAVARAQKATLMALVACDTPATADLTSPSSIQHEQHERGRTGPLPGNGDLNTWDEPSLQCCVCDAEVELYDEHGRAYCEKHWQQFSEHTSADMDGTPVAVDITDTATSARGHGIDTGGRTGLFAPLIAPLQEPLQEPQHHHLGLFPSGTHSGRGAMSGANKPVPTTITANKPVPPTITANKPVPATITTTQEISALGAEWDAVAPKQMVIDLETTGLDPRKKRVITIALGVPGKVTIIDMRGYYAADPEQQRAWCEALQQLLQRDDILWIGHNLKFDWSFLAQQFGVRLRRVYDTMLVEKLLRAGTNRSVALLACAGYYRIPLSKVARSWFIDLDRRPREWSDPLPEVQLTYIRQDISVPYQIYERQQEAIVRHELAQVVALENQALPALAALELRGVCVDQEQWRSILAVRHRQKVALEGQIKLALRDVWAHSGPLARQETLFDGRRVPEINLASSQKLLQALRRPGIRINSVTNEALQEVQAQHEIIPLLLKWKALEKFENCYGEKVLSFVTAQGRIHATFDQWGAASGRITCREPNLQQIPRPAGLDDPYDLRRCFIAPRGYKLLSADLSNIELRILAELSGDATMLRFFAEEKDLHSETARMMFDLAQDVDPRVFLINGKKARDIAKTINFGLAYGMGAPGLAARVGVDIPTAHRLMQTYFETYPTVSRYLMRSGKEAVACGYARSLSGRKRFFTQDELYGNRGEAERSARNHPIQGSNADILKCAMSLLYQRLPAGASIVLTIHDELVLECPDALIDQVTPLLKGTMVQACRAYLKVVAIPEPEVLVGAYWRKD